MKTIKILYGGDAEKIRQIETGDWMIIDLINEAMKILHSNKRIKILLTTIQLSNLIEYNDGSLNVHWNTIDLTGIINYLPIKAYKSTDKIQKATITCGDKVIKIFTSRE